MAKIADLTAANTVSGTISALPAAADITLDNAQAVADAKAAYDALTDDQKALVPADTVNKLNAAVAKIADLTAANTVSGTISALPDFSNVTTANKDAIEAARTAYNALTDDQKAYVSADTIKKLTDAEDKLVIIQVMSEVSAKTGSGMIYTGNPIQLINTPTTALPAGYTMYYAVTTENVAPTDDNLYTTSIPAKTDAGTYYVWYRAYVGENNYTEAVCITVSIAKRNVTLTSATDSKAYDGTALTNNDVTVSGDGFVTGEGATYNVTGTQTLPGESDNVFTYVLNEGTSADNYTISKTEGKLTVTDRTNEGTDKKYEITITANSDEVTYDGTEHSISGFVQTVFAFNGVTYTVTGLSAEAIATDAGTYTATVTGTPVVKDSNNNDLTAQFIVNTNNGTLTINKRNVTLTSATDTKTYDGNELTNDTVTVTGDGFVTGEGAVYNVTGSQKVVGSSSNAFTYTLNEGTKADNYNITKIEGTLTVTNRDAKYEIAPVAQSDTVKYDGQSHTVTGFVTDTFTVDGNTYTVSGLTATGTGTDAGSYTVSVSGTALVKDSDGNDVTTQFAVTPQTGTLIINRRSVTLTSASETKEYDGHALTNGTVTVSGDGFVTGEGATYNVTGTRTLVGTSENTFTYILNEGTNADNYNITKAEGTLTVTNRDAKYEIAPVAQSDTVKYDGQSHTVTGFVTDTFTVDGNTYTLSGLTATAEGTDAGEYTVNVNGTPVVKDASGNDVSSEFSVVPVTGKLVIEKRSVTMTSSTKTKDYDGEDLTDDTITVTGDGFADGEGAAYTVTGIRTVAGTAENIFTYTLNEGTKADNYDIKTVYGILTVNASDVDTGDVQVEISQGETKAVVSDSIPGTVKAEAEIIAKSTTAELEKTAEEQVKQIVGNSQDVTADDKNIVIVPSLETNISEYTISGDDTTLTIDIEAVYTTYETAKDITDASEVIANAGDADKVKEIGSGTLNTEGKPVKVTFEVPSNFANALGATTENTLANAVPVYVKHTHKDKNYEYPGTLYYDGTGKYLVTFTNPNGFSPFTVYKASKSVAGINGKNYTDFQSAIAELANGDTVVILNNDNMTAQLSKEMTFTLDKNGHSGFITFTVAQGLTYTYSDKGDGKYEYKVTAVSSTPAPYVPSTPVETPTTTPTTTPTPTVTPIVTPTPTETPTVTPAPVEDKITAGESAKAAIDINAGLKVYPKNSDIVVKWGKVDNADRYVIYAAYCKKGRKCAKIATLDGDANTYIFSELNGKAINTKKNIKVYVVAYRKVNGKYKKITSSITAHIVGSGSKKHSNVKGIKIESTKIILSLDDNTAAPSSYTLNPVAVLKDSSKKMLLHTAEFRYATSNSSVATVGKDGTITAKGKGTCYIYVYAQNGYAKKIKVTVK